MRAAWSIALPVAITLLGFGLRLYRIDHQSIWWDEAHSIFVARGGLRAVWDLPHTVSYNHPPLHYALLVGWVRLAGVSELAVRAPSLLFGTLLLPATYLLIRRLLNRRAALAAMLVVTLAPVYVYFSQEARVYALLPLLYVLMLAVLHRIFQQGRAAPARLWVALAALEAAALFAHYFMVLAVITVNLLLAAWWLRTRDVPVRRWALSQGAAVAPFALWALRLTASIELLQADLAVTAGIADPVRSVWRIVRFLLGGQAAHVSSDERLLTAVGVLAALIVLGLLALAAGSGRRSPVWWLVLATLVPLALALPVYILVPQTQPRYLLAFSAPLFAAVGAAVAELLAGRVWQRPAGAVLMASALVTFGLGWYAATFDGSTFRDDARSVAAYLDAHTTPHDAVIVSPNDYSVPYYYQGDAAVYFSDDGDFTSKAAQLAAVTQGVERLFLVHWRPSNVDYHGLRSFLLERAGRLVEVQRFHGLDVMVYDLAGPVEGLPRFTPAQGRAGPLALTGVSVEPQATTDSAVTVALRWRLDEPTGQNLKVAVRLVDASEYMLGTSDSLLRLPSNLPTSGWAPGTESMSFHVVPVPAGWAPGEYEVAATVYDDATLERLAWADGSETLALGSVELVAGQHADADPYGTWAGVAWQLAQTSADGWALEALSTEPATPQPGRPLDLLLRWRVEDNGAAGHLPLIRLVHGGEVHAEASASPAIRFDSDLPAGSLVIERRTLVYPPVRGDVDLVLGEGESGPVAATLWLEESALLWDAPPVGVEVGASFGDAARLLRAEVGETVTAGQPFEITLYWQAAGDSPAPVDYTVFTHLLAADGRLIAQHDGPPAGGARPLSTWVPGEVIEDRHELTFLDPAYTGPARLVVGLYDPATIERVLTGEGPDHAVVPVEIEVRP